MPTPPVPSTSKFARVPVELLQEFLAYALETSPAPADLLSVSRTFLELGQPLLHARLRFRSINSLILFSQGAAPLVCAPKSLSVTLAGGSADYEVFTYLAAALKRCRRSLQADETRQEGPGGTGEPEEATQVPLELLSLRLHSHINNPHLACVYEALSLANPKTFVWMGPDPDHHFSTAIVPVATYHLVRALSTWTAVEHITLTNLSFPSDELGLHTPFARDEPLLPALPSLRTLYVGQATLLSPGGVAAMLAQPGAARLARVRLVDAYSHSIWGPRIRRRDVESAAGALRGLDEAQRAALVERVRAVVSCEKRTERIMGGDSGDGQGVLE
ncbi:hypothetical protein BD413DRAFT_479577 [Trametes elegans]|nr:hypothetical protein BD413DRAFT_479577 [Trametes elegans]